MSQRPRPKYWGYPGCERGHPENHNRNIRKSGDWKYVYRWQARKLRDYVKRKINSDSNEKN